MSPRRAIREVFLEIPADFDAIRVVIGILLVVSKNSA
jgi:hypothetical protein